MVYVLVGVLALRAAFGGARYRRIETQ